MGWLWITLRWYVPGWGVLLCITVHFSRVFPIEYLNPRQSRSAFVISEGLDGHSHLAKAVKKCVWGLF